MSSNQPSLITVKVQTRASQNKIAQWKDNILKVRITAPPIDGEANRVLIEFLSKELDVRKSSIQIVRGESSKNKKIVISQITMGELNERLLRLIGSPLSRGLHLGGINE